MRVPTCSFTSFAVANGREKKGMPQCAAARNPDQGGHVFLRCTNCYNSRTKYMCTYCLEGCKVAVNATKANAHISPLMNDFLSIDWKDLNGKTDSLPSQLNLVQDNIYEFKRKCCVLCDSYKIPDAIQASPNNQPKFNIASFRKAYNNDRPDVLEHPPVDVDDIRTYLHTNDPSSPSPLPARLLYIGCNVTTHAKDANLALKADAPVYENLHTVYKPPEEHHDGRSRHIVLYDRKSGDVFCVLSFAGRDGADLIPREAKQKLHRISAYLKTSNKYKNSNITEEDKKLHSSSHAAHRAKRWAKAMKKTNKDIMVVAGSTSRTNGAFGHVGGEDIAKVRSRHRVPSNGNSPNLSAGSSLFIVKANRVNGLFSDVIQIYPKISPVGANKKADEATTMVAFRQASAPMRFCYHVGVSQIVEAIDNKEFLEEKSGRSVKEAIAIATATMATAMSILTSGTATSIEASDQTIATGQTYLRSLEQQAPPTGDAVDAWVESRASCSVTINTEAVYNHQDNFSAKKIPTAEATRPEWMVTAAYGAPDESVELPPNGSASNSIRGATVFVQYKVQVVVSTEAVATIVAHDKLHGVVPAPATVRRQGTKRKRTQWSDGGEIPHRGAWAYSHALGRYVYYPEGISIADW